VGIGTTIASQLRVIRGKFAGNLRCQAHKISRAGGNRGLPMEISWARIAQDIGSKPNSEATACRTDKPDLAERSRRAPAVVNKSSPAPAKFPFNF
jgi:hypothetical protein